MSIQDLPRFYSSSASEGNTVELDSEEGKHARVLRIQLGDPVHVVDGKGGLYEGKALPSKKRFEVSDLQLVKRTEAPVTSLTLAVAPTKNIARFEWVIEKAVEVGVDRIVPIFSEHSERSKLRLDRLDRIALSAAKQSKALWVPVIEEPQRFDAFIQNAGANTWIAHCHDAITRRPITDLIAVPAGEAMQLLIGPEGDFSPEEVNRAYALGCHGLDLGQKRLRTETAAIAVVIAAALMRG
ncbi:MAG: 16S rRNA (uracil(1498)-N(3))-methyltransferase [Flavobacteriales bacterium]|nr:16S rRNA (uracil(1498)-N(3))-methyltransferase [Flavobacteriales bacterium]